MYYAGPPNGTAIPQQEKTAAAGGMFIPGQPSPYGATGTLPPGFPQQPPAQQVLPNGLAAAQQAARFTHGPQAFAVVSSPAHHPQHPSFGNVYSMAYPGVPTAIPTSSHHGGVTAYLPAAQYPGGVGFQHAALGGRSLPPSHYTMQAPVQAGAPLFAAGYPPVHHPGMAGPPGATRNIPMGHPLSGTALPPGYAFPSAAAAPSSETAGPPVAYAPAGYVPQF